MRTRMSGRVAGASGRPLPLFYFGGCTDNRAIEDCVFVALPLKEIKCGDFPGVIFSGSRREPDLHTASFPLWALVCGRLHRTVGPGQRNLSDIGGMKGDRS